MAPAVRHFVDHDYASGGMGNTFCTVVAGLLLASSLDASLLMDASHANRDPHSVAEVLGMAKGTMERQCGVHCGAGFVVPATELCGADHKKENLNADFTQARGTCHGFNAKTPGLPFLDERKVATWRSKLAREPRTVVLQSNQKKPQGKFGCNICAHSHPHVADVLRARRFAVTPRPAEAPPGKAFCGRSAPAGTLTVGLHVRRGDCPKWRFVSWHVYHNLLVEIDAALRGLPDGSPAKARFNGGVSACVVTENPKQFGAELAGELKKMPLPQGVRVLVNPAAPPPKSTPARRLQHVTHGQLDDFNALADDFDVVVDSLSSFVYFAALFSRGVKLMLTWTMPYDHLSCALPVRWRRPTMAKGAWTYPENSAPLLDAHAFAETLERYAAQPRRATNGTNAHVPDGSCFDLDRTRMGPYVSPKPGTKPAPGAPFRWVEPPMGAVVSGVDVRPARLDPPDGDLANWTASPWTRWTSTCKAPQAPLR